MAVLCKDRNGIKCALLPIQRLSQQIDVFRRRRGAGAAARNVAQGGMLSKSRGEQKGKVMRLMARDKTMGSDIYGVATWTL